MLYFFFFQAEDGIRDVAVTGVQTCALPISIMPGMLIIEAMAQVGGMLLMSHFEGQNVEDKVMYFMSLDHVKFRRPVVPGDQIRFELEMLSFRGKTCKMKGVGYVEGQVVAEAEMMAMVVDK